MRLLEVDGKCGFSAYPNPPSMQHIERLFMPDKPSDHDAILGDAQLGKEPSFKNVLAYRLRVAI